VVNDLYPFTSHFATIRGLSYHYLDEGQGHPVVMVHGNPTWSFYYRNVVKNLRRNYRCLVPDHIGCGLSSKPNLSVYDFQLRSRIEDLGAWLDSLQLQEPVTLICHDWGGMIGSSWAVKNPAKVARLVFLNTGAFTLPKSKSFPWRIWLGRNTRLGAWLILKKNLFCKHALNAAMNRKKLSPEVQEMYLQPYDTPEHRLAVLKFVQTIPLTDRDRGMEIVKATERGLSQFQNCPTLLVWGLKDFVFDHHFLDRFRELLPNAEVTEYPQAGHYLLEDQEEEVIPRIRTFLEQTDHVLVRS
jgi:cis-3-alkyl-4-acyloxetan-2-one decarboxylase